jgi:hypothetical protein
MIHYSYRSALRDRFHRGLSIAFRRWPRRQLNQNMLDFHFSPSDPEAWVQEQLNGADLGDPRRTRRAQTIAAALARQPGDPIPRLFERKYQIDAAYAFFDRPEATPDAIQAGHRRAVLEQAAQPGATVLHLEDTTEPSFSGKAPIAGLGPIGKGQNGQQGFGLHSVLSVRWPELAPPQERAEPGRRPAVRVLGLADQRYRVRPSRQRTRTRRKRAHARRTPNPPLKSQLWLEAGAQWGPAPIAVRWVRVCDREADIYEFLADCQRLGHGFVVRACQDRALEGAGGKAAPRHLFETARELKPLGQFELFLRERKGQSARTAQLAVAATPVRLRAPARPGHGVGALPAIAATVVRVWEEAPPEGVEALEWIVLTDAAAQTFAAALEVALQYSCRWLIEEFHKALKTGLGAERLQLETAGRLFAAIALMSVVALRLVELREAVRVAPEAPAEQAGLSPVELKVLRARLKRPLATVREVALAIGKLGGHMNRKGDGMPGLITLWRGMKVLQVLVQGFLLAEELQRFQE